MTNLELLCKKIGESGITMTALARKLGMSRETLYNKTSGRSEFKASEIILITRVLHLTKEERDAIFLDTNVNVVHG